mmetsp:Transcript_55474/g.135922  ORF Transcript_55474/g.135922 Transcript_55474/m.135922 type:complete len:138 (-) Transcript_55474:218-631(-)
MAVGDGVKEVWKKFRQVNVDYAALVLKLDKDEETIVVDGDGYQEVSPEDLAEDMSDTSPRWIIWSVKIARDDGRVQYPLIPLYFSPKSCNERARMLYSSKTVQVSAEFELAKVHALSDLDDMTMDALTKMHLSTVTR